MLRCMVLLTGASLLALHFPRGADTSENAELANPKQPPAVPRASVHDKFDVVLLTRNEVDNLIRNFPRRGFGFVELGKVVKPFSSYLDVSITHMHVPESSALALFEFSAYKRPRNCMQQYQNETIVIYLQHGSTPLVDESYFALPERVYAQRTHLYRTSMIADQRSHYFKLSSPLPGDWYSVAFLNPMLSQAASLSTSDTSGRVMPAEIRRFTQTTRKCSIVVTSTLHIASRGEAVQDVIFKSDAVDTNVTTTGFTHEREDIPASPRIDGETDSFGHHDRGFAVLEGDLSATIPRTVYRILPPDGLFCSVLVELDCEAGQCRVKFRHSAVPAADSGADNVALDCKSEPGNATTCSSTVGLRSDISSFISVELLRLTKADVVVQPYKITLTKFCCPMPAREVFLRSPVDKHIGSDAVRNQPHISATRSAAVWQRQQLLCPSTYEQLSRIDYGLPFSSRFYIKRSILPFLQDLLFIPTHRRSVQVFEFALNQQDSGGTFWLRIDTQFPYTETFASGKIDVQFCLGMHRLPLKLFEQNNGGGPEVWCDAESIIELRIESNGTSPHTKQYVWEIYVPYPEPGPYYLVIVSRPLRTNSSSLMLNRQKRARHDAEAEIRHSQVTNLLNEEVVNSPLDGELHAVVDDSELEESPTDSARSSSDGFVVVQFQAMMQQCFDGIACNRRGRCRLSLLGGSVVTTACECFNGYRGMDCGDATHAIAAKQITLSIFVLTASNIVYIPAAIIAWCRNYQLEAIIYVAAASFSTMYHLCDRPPDGSSVCVLDYNTLQFADFYAAVLSVWVTLIALAELPHLLLLQLAHIAGSILIAVVVRHNATALYAFLLPCAVGIVILLASWLYRKLRLGSFYPSVPYLMLHFVPGVCVAVAGLLVFGWLQTEHNYQLVHSVWHVIMGVAIVIILPTRTLRYGNRPKSPVQVICDAAAVTTADEEAGANHLDSVAAAAAPTVVLDERDGGLIYADRTPLSQCRSSRTVNTSPSTVQSDERMECVSLVDSAMEYASVGNDAVENQGNDTLHKSRDVCTLPVIDVPASASSINSSSLLSSSSSGGDCHTTSSSMPSVVIAKNDDIVVSSPISDN